jgi:hypothetical protein
MKHVRCARRSTSWRSSKRCGNAPHAEDAGAEKRSSHRDHHRPRPPPRPPPARPTRFADLFHCRPLPGVLARNPRRPTYGIL